LHHNRLTSLPYSCQVLHAPGRLAILVGFALLYLFLTAGVCGVERRERTFHGAVQEKMDR
jgi:hypothetical protein